MSKRKRYSPQQKVEMLHLHFIEGTPVSDICDKHELHPNVFYKWQKLFFERGAAVFEKESSRQEKKLEKKIAGLNNKLSHKDEVIAEIMEEQIKLKKNLGEL